MTPPTPWTDFDGEAFWTRLDRLYVLTSTGPKDAAAVEDFVEAQEEVLAALLGVEARRDVLRRERAAHSRAEHERATRTLDRAEAAIRRAADGLAWLMVNGQLWILRRLHAGMERPVLGTSEWQSVLATAREYCRSHPGEFALMTDLTSFIDIGDLLVRTRDSLTIIEVKTGAVNARLMSALFGHGTPEPLETVFAEHGDGAIRQAERMLRQAGRMTNAAKILKTGRGQEYGKELRVFGDEPMKEDQYTHQLASILEGTSARGRSIGEVDGCLFIGAYKGNAVLKSGAVFSAWMNSDPALEGPTIDLRQASSIPLATPLHVRPMLRKYALAIERGDLRVLIRLALPLFGRLASEKGLTLASLSKAKTEEFMRNAPSRSDIFLWKQRALGASYHGVKIALGGGLLGRVLHSQLSPSGAIEITRRMFDAALPSEGERGR